MKLTIVFVLPFIVLTGNRLRAQNQGTLQINSDISVHFVVIDPQGRKTGVDPRGVRKPWIGRAISEIPGANYSTSGVGDNPTINQLEQSDNSHEFLYGLRSPENDGVYQIECIGWKPVRYSLYVDVTPDDTSSMQPFRAIKRGLIDKNEVVKYTFEYYGRPEATVRFEELVTETTLRQDLDNSYKLKLLGDKGFYGELLNILDNYEKHLSKKNASDATKELQKFQGKMTEEYKDGTRSRDKRFVTADALQILSYDVKYLIDHLLEKSKHGREDDKDKKPKK
jgi:hypothetical protein